MAELGAVVHWKLTITETSLGPTLILPDELLAKLDIDVGDTLVLDRSARGFTMKKAPDNDSTESKRK